MKRSVALAHFRQLSCLGLEGPQAISAMMRELPNIMSGARAVVAWTEPDGTPKDIWVSEVIAPVLDLFFNEHQRYLGPNEPSLERCALAPAASVRMWEAFGPDFMDRSNTFHDVFQPYRMGHMLSIPIRRAGRPLGLMGCYRDLGDRPFNSMEEAELVGLVPYIRHAMLSADEGWEMVESSERGVILCDPEGRILSQSTTARQLMMQAVNGHLKAGIGQMEITLSTLPRRLAPISAALARIARGEPAAPPRMTIQNRWGVFEITAQAMAPTTTPGAEPDPICLMICRKEPLPLRLARRLRDQPISERQKQLALHLALNRSTDDILDRMGIGPHTYRDHLRAVFAGMGVSSRAELLSRLLV
jgi:DNA-binding CsgD family transcriptional regulator